jgi:hypothetical protein
VSFISRSQSLSFLVLSYGFPVKATNCLGVDEDIPDIVPNHGPAEPSQTPNTPIHGPITQSRANKLQQEVNSLLTKIDYNANENFILPKFSTYALLRFMQRRATAGPKEMSYTEDEMSYEEAEPSQ